MTEFTERDEKSLRLLDYGKSDEKIDVLESLSDAKEPLIISKIIEKLDDPDIRVRGEAFSALVLNENNISDLLIKNLESDSKNIRGFSALVLANRKDKEAVHPIIKLTEDESSLVRSCALGALGYLKATEAKMAIHKCLKDPNLEVKKSALQAAINLGETVQSNELEHITKDKDKELEKMLVKVRKN